MRSGDDGARASEIAGVVLAALALLAAGGCLHGPDEGSSRKLDELRSDPMARYVPPGARLMESDEVNEHTAFGKPSPARITRRFSLRDGDLEAVLEGAIDAAAKAGWDVSSRVIRLEGASGRTARRQLASGRARLRVTVRPTGTHTGAGTALVIHLEHP